MVWSYNRPTDVNLSKPASRELKVNSGSSEDTLAVLAGMWPSASSISLSSLTKLKWFKCGKTLFLSVHTQKVNDVDGWSSFCGRSVKLTPGQSVHSHMPKQNHEEEQACLHTFFAHRGFE